MGIFDKSNYIVNTGIIEQFFDFWLNIFDLWILNDLLCIVNCAGLTYNTEF